MNIKVAVNFDLKMDYVNKETWIIVSYASDNFAWSRRSLPVKKEHYCSSCLPYTNCSKKKKSLLTSEAFCKSKGLLLLNYSL